MLTNDQLEDLHHRASRAKMWHMDAFTHTPITPDDLTTLITEIKRQRWYLERLRRVWLGEREPNQAVYQAHHDWVLNTWPDLVDAIEQLISAVPPRSR
jgi:hypothetical protein